MAFQDKTLTCAAAGATFTFSAEDQEFFQSKGYTNEPKRCLACRQARKTERYGGGGGSGSGSYGRKPQREMFPAVCAQCGKETQVPFEPREGKPVYCSACYRKSKMNK